MKIFSTLLIVTMLFVSALAANTADDEPTLSGRMLRSYWYEPGIEHGNPTFNSRFRVNVPQAVIHPSYMHRAEVRANGMMQIPIEEDLAQIESAELYLELWGGHPGTANKRVTINGRSTYMLPEVGTANHNCTHDYPTIPLKITDLVNGYNVLQFACDEGSSFWGHFIVENACLRLQLKPEHPAWSEAGITGFEANVIAEQDGEKVILHLDFDSKWKDKIESVTYQGFYTGYDENGDGAKTDWHGFTKKREPVAYLGAVDRAPFRVEWDTAMLPDQQFAQVRASVRFQNQPELVYETDAAPLYFIGSKTTSIYYSYDFPHPFWSRANNEKTCTIQLDVDPSGIESAVLHNVAWDGGHGNVEDYFTLNGHFLAIAEEGHHDVLYKQIDIDPKILQKGENTIRLLSDTEHHGIEIQLPGPALVVKKK